VLMRTFAYKLFPLICNAIWPMYFTLNRFTGTNGLFKKIAKLIMPAVVDILIFSKLFAGDIPDNAVECLHASGVQAITDIINKKKCKNSQQQTSKQPSAEGKAGNKEPQRNGRDTCTKSGIEGRLKGETRGLIKEIFFHSLKR